MYSAYIEKKLLIYLISTAVNVVDPRASHIFYHTLWSISITWSHQCPLFQTVYEQSMEVSPDITKVYSDDKMICSDIDQGTPPSIEKNTTTIT